MSIVATAIVSLYKCERYLDGCLESLERQTLFQAGQLEILMINSASPEGENAIAERWIKLWPKRIRLVQLGRKETLYATWNRAASLARGRYLTCANADDRHEARCLERLAAALEAEPELGMAYGVQRLSTRDNLTFEQADPAAVILPPRFFPPLALLHCPMGCQPMWRKSIHEKLGGFDETWEALGDYDFLIRVALVASIRRVDGAWGVFLDRPSSLSASRQVEEDSRFDARWRQIDTVLALYGRAGCDVSNDTGRGRALLDFAFRCLAYFTVWGGRWTPRSRLSLAQRALRAAMDTPFAEMARRNLESLARFQTNEWSADDEIVFDLDEPIGEDNLSLMYPIVECCPAPPAGFEWTSPTALNRLRCASLANAGLGLSFDELLDTLAIRAKGRPIAIWGLGDRGRALVALLPPRGWRISRIVDRNPALRGRRYKGLRVESPATLDGSEPRPYIVLGTANVESAARDLLEANFAPLSDFFPVP